MTTDTYTAILLATDFSAHAAQAGSRAKDLATRYQATLHLIHVVEEIPVYDLDEDPIIPLGIDLDMERAAQARRQLDRLAGNLGLVDAPREVLMGRPKSEIVRYAREHDIDLIVVGTHGHAGLARLLGSTASSVLHSAPCDVLAVKLGKGED